MSKYTLMTPQGYQSKLDIMQTEAAIKLAKDTFERILAKKLNLTRVSAPLFVRPESGLNDDLSGVERAVQFDVKDIGADVQIVHSLAKWKRMALARYGFQTGTGLYTDMNAIRRDEELDNIHSVYVDQWDWEKVITAQERTRETLEKAVESIYDTLKATQETVHSAYPDLCNFLPPHITFLTTQELAEKYPSLTPKEREDACAKEYGAVFLIGIGGKLASGEPHDSRAPDYDDWTLNGDILVWFPVLERAIELSSMGIRVDEETLLTQLETANCNHRKALSFHQALLRGSLPLTMGGGIGQSRLCMIMLQKAHIGEVQASVWSEEMQEECSKHNIVLL